MFAQRIKRYIERASNAIPLDHFLGLVTQEYYRNLSALGRDFITAPEISPLFGKAIGLWIYDKWSRDGGNKPILLVELGPGNGSLMREVLASPIPELSSTRKQVLLVENSPSLQAEQQRNLEPWSQTCDISWVKELDMNLVTSLASSLQAELFIIANEFFDAIPIKQWVIEGDRAHEIIVTVRSNIVTGQHQSSQRFESMGPIFEPKLLDIFPEPGVRVDIQPTDTPLSNVRLSSDGQLALAIDRHGLPLSSYRALHHSNENIGAELRFYEHSPGTTYIVDSIASSCESLIEPTGLKSHCLIIDYGYTNPPQGSSLQAVHRHQKLDNIFQHLGEADISAHVNFRAIANTFSRYRHVLCDITDQGQFLRKYLKHGIENYERHISQIPTLRRLTSDDEMGRLFKVFEASFQKT